MGPATKSANSIQWVTRFDNAVQAPREESKPECRRVFRATTPLRVLWQLPPSQSRPLQGSRRAYSEDARSVESCKLHSDVDRGRRFPGRSKTRVLSAALTRPVKFAV